MNILITGGAGFIGSNLAEELSKKHEVIIIDDLSTGRVENVEDLDVELAQGSITDLDLLKDNFRDIDYVFHQAALPSVQRSVDDPVLANEVNVGGTLNVLNACRTVEVDRLVHTSTSEVYGTAQYVPIDEKHPLQGQSPYSATKIGADMLAESFCRSFNLPAVIMRPFNTYGPRQSARAVIPTILSQLYEGSKQIKLGALHPTRDFNFVEDIVSGFLALAEADAVVGRVLNVGSGKEISIGDLVDLLFRITGKAAEVICEEERFRPEKSEVDRLLCDASLAKKFTGWQPEHTLEEGLEITAHWMEKHLHSYRAKIYNV